MEILLFENKKEMSAAAAVQAISAMKRAIALNGCARILAATGASQFEFLDALAATPAFDWRKVEMFHLDEYIGLPITHPASFRKYLLERLISRTGIERYYLLDGEGNPAEVIHRTGQALSAATVDVAFVGIGENGHLAFNDPPADFETEEPFIVVNLDEACRRQQVSEGWFVSFEDVPAQAISISIKQILKAREIICIAPDERKAQAVKACFSGEISPLAPASILRIHPDVTVYLDRQSASLLDPKLIAN